MVQNKMFLTVIIRCFNRDECIRECLESAISQTFIDKMQILIIDDGSIDNSLSIIQNIKNDNPSICIDIIQHDKNKGRGKALNTAKQYIKGKYCCILDSDDIYNRNTWVEELYNEIGNNEYGIMYNGNIHAYHWNNIYLSKLFKICPICNINYYEDHYTNWFFNNENLMVYKYNLPHFVIKIEESKDRHNNSYYINNKKFANTTLQKLYEDVFFYRKHKNTDELIYRFNELNTDKLDDVLLESYNEIKSELKL